MCASVCRCFRSAKHLVLLYSRSPGSSPNPNWNWSLLPLPPCIVPSSSLSTPFSVLVCLQTLRQINWCSLKTKREPKSKKKLSKVATSSGNNRTNFGFFFGLFFFMKEPTEKTHRKFCRATFAWMRPKMVHNAEQPCLVCGVCSQWILRQVSLNVFFSCIF